ncbi:MAG: sigma-54-dependent Fis family transcriptional regulator [Desulfobacterales bacterium]|nr:sigma-54-dependent Fis family transcriptional regulator [Desulfobacterales bacterium]
MTNHIYVVDDEEYILEASVLNLGEIYCVDTFSTGEAAIKAVEKNQPDLMLLDIGLPGISGIEVLKQVKKQYPEIIVIIITAHDDVTTGINAMKIGAYDYVVKPINMDNLLITIEHALDTIRLRKEVQLLQEQYLKEHLPYFIGQSDLIMDVIEVVNIVAKSPDTPVVIYGETGTGKELIASSIHYKSPNFRAPFVTINCAAIPTNLIESELFGYERGSFSGAEPSGKKGLIEMAEGGTLFLDEIADMSMDIQAKLLRFLDSGEFYKIGGTKKYYIKTRIVAASNRKLEELVEEGLFRKDLYYRLSVFKIEIPTLNQRSEDIIPMAKHFLLKFNKKLGKSFSGISKEAQHVLKNYNWKGNIRELRNIIERAVIIGKEPEITLNDLGLYQKNPKCNEVFSNNQPQQKAKKILPVLTEAGINLTNLHESIDQHYYREALQLTKGNESGAARLLNMNYYAFRRRREKLDIE